MPSIDPVIFEFEAKVDQFKADINGAQRLADRKLDAIETRGRQMGEGLKAGFSVAKTAALAYAASLGVEAITGAISKSLDYAATLERSAQIANTTTTEFQKVAFAARTVGIESDKLADIYKDVNDKFGEFISTGGGELKDFFTNVAPKVGITADAFKNLSGPQALQLYVSSLERAGLSQQQMTFYLEALANDATALLPILRENGAEYQRLAKSAEDLGGVMDETMIQKSVEARKKLKELNAVLEAKINVAVAENAGEIVKLAEALAYLIEKAGGAVKAWQDWKREVAARQFDMMADAEAGWLGSGDPKKIKQFRDNAAALRSGGGPAAPARAPGTFRVTPGAPAQRVGGGLGNPFAGARIGGPLKTNFAGGGTDSLSPGQGIALLGIDPVSAIRAVDEFTAQMQRMTADIALVQAQISGSLEDRAAAEKLSVDAEAAAALSQLAADDRITDAKRQELEALVQKKASIDKQLIDQRLAADLSARSREQSEDMDRLEIDALSAEADIADNRKERARIAASILDIQQDLERKQLEEQLAQDGITEAAKALARAKLARKQKAEKAAAEEESLSPGGRYLADLNKEAANLDDAFERAATNGLERLNDGLSRSVKSALGLHGILGDIVGDFIEIAIRQAIIKPLAESLFGGSGGGGGDGLGGLLSGVLNSVGSFFGGRASGGSVTAGRAYRVNEAASPGRVEGFIPQGSGQIIPLGRMNALAAGGQGQNGGVVRIVVEEAEGFATRVRTEAIGVAVEVHRALQPQTVDMATRETQRRLTRPRI